MTPDPGKQSWASNRGRELETVARNISTRYMAIAAEMIIGLVMLPFNLAHLGAAQYGLWVLLGSVTIHLSILDLGYGGAIIKFMAQYRAHRDTRALNEIASTMFFVFAATGLLAYGVATALALNLDHVFNMTVQQAETGKWILLIIGVHVALNFPFSVYGGVTGGFQRFDINNIVAIIIAVAAAAVNAAVLLAGYGLITLVAATTAVRLLGYYIYRLNALRIFPELRIHPSLFRKSRLREVTGFSIYASIIDWANKLNYELDKLVIGVFFGSAYVGVWAVAERIIAGTQRLTNQLNGVLFPVIVDSDTSNRQEKLQWILLQGTLLSLVMVVPISTALILLADPLVRAWVGPEMLASVTDHPGPGSGRRDPGWQRDRDDATQGRGRASHAGVGESRHRRREHPAERCADQAIRTDGCRHRHADSDRAYVLFIVQPAAWRRVGVSGRRALRQSILPAIWPAFVVGGALALTRHISSGTFLAVAVQAIAAGMLYLALFFTLAIGC